MPFFDFLKPKRSDRLLVDTIEFNANHIVKSEDKNRSEATYLAICALLDDLAKRPNGKSGHKQVMGLLQKRYAVHQNEVFTYIAWSRGAIKLKPEYEKALIARHN